MPNKDYHINRREVRSQSEYEAAMRDAEKIKYIQKEYRLEELSQLREVYRKLQNGTYKFESFLGQRFDDAIYETYQKRKEEKAEPVAKGKKQKENKKAVISLEDCDDTMKSFIKEELVKQEKRRKRFLVIAALVGMLCICYVCYNVIMSRRSEARWDDLAALIGSEQLSSSEESGTVIANLENEEYIVPDILSKYETLYNSNKNLIGWLQIDDTIIDYPVMQCDNNTYYLNHNFDQEEDSAGALFMDCNNDVIRGNDNYIIYGHHLSSGRMFSSLENYESESYFEEHRYINFDTIYEEQVFEVMYVFRSRVYNEEDVVFKYYQFIDANSEEEFLSYMNEMAEMSFYDTGVTASYGDTLLTLSTCDYNETNGRFVVVAKRIQ